MAVTDYSFEGLRTSGTFKVDSTTKGVIQSDPQQIIGKVVTITGDGEAGYGSADDEPLGVATQIEKECTNSEDFVITVAWGQTFENIPSAGSENAGEFLACNGDGTVKTSVEHTGCKVIAADNSGSVCTIKIV